MEDVALLAVGVHQKRDSRAPVGIVLDLRDPGRDAELLPAEVDLPVVLPVAAAQRAHRHVAEVVAPARLLLGLEQRLLGRPAGDLVEAGDGAEPRPRRDRPELPDAHLSPRRWGGTRPP